MINRQLPKFCVSGRDMQGPEGVVLHYFSCKNVDKEKQFDLDCCRELMVDLNSHKSLRNHYLKDRNSPDSRMYASAHVFIGREGEVWKLVDFDKQAYHAGKSFLNGRTGCNKWTLGVELIGTNTSGFTDEQYASLAELLNNWRVEFGIELDQIAGHDAVRHGAIVNGDNAKKKYDPSGKSDGTGDNFDWTRLLNLMDIMEEVG